MAAKDFGTTPERSERAQGTHGYGKGSYTPAEYQRVVEAIKASGETPLTVQDLHERTGVSGLTVRRIISAADGVSILLGGNGARGYRAATSIADAEKLTHRLSSQVEAMSSRVNRRLEYARRWAKAKGAD